MNNYVAGDRVKVHSIGGVFLWRGTVQAVYAENPAVYAVLCEDGVLRRVAQYCLLRENDA